MKRFFWFLVSLFVACTAPDHSEEQKVLMEKRLQDKINKFITDEMAKCRKELLEEASTTADSILRVTNPILIQIDSIQRPPKPEKPTVPNFTRPKDSIIIAPIISPKKLDEH